MRAHLRRIACVCAILLVTVIPLARAAEQGRLVAPLYPGAKPADDTPNCGPTSESAWSVCSQYTTDSVDKVKAFYDQKIGAKRFRISRTQGGEILHWAPLAWRHYAGEDGEAETFPGVTLRARIAPSWPAGSDAARAMLEQSSHFGGFLDAVDWTGGTLPINQGLRTPQQLKDLYAKYGYLEGRYFADEKTVTELRDKYRRAIEPRLRAIKQQREKDERQAQEQLERDMGKFQADAMAQQQRILEGNDPETEAERKEMEALMKRKPALWAKAKPHYEKGKAIMDEAMAAMQAGKDYDEKKLRIGEAEMKKANDILRTDPEVAALQDKNEARAQAKSSAMMQRMMNIGSRDGYTAAQVKYNKARSDALWQNWTAYLADVAKLPNYATRVEVSHATPGDGKGYSDKPETVAKMLDRVGQNLTFAFGESASAEMDGKGRAAASTTAPSSKQTAQGGGKPSDQQPAAKPEKEKKSAADEAAETAKKAGQEGLKLLKKLW